MRHTLLAILLLTMWMLQGCLQSKDIKSFECTYGPNGGQSLSESIALFPKITTPEGVELVPRKHPKANLIQKRIKNSTSANLKEYKISIVGGTKRSKSNIIDIDHYNALEINRKLQVIISPKKKRNLKDTIEFIMDYEGPFSRSFDPSIAGESAHDVLIDVEKIQDDTFYSNFQNDLFLVKITHNGTTEMFYMSTKNSSLFVSNRGANGKNGRDGEDGARGKQGADGTPGHKGEDGGPGHKGSNGTDGSNAGHGGKVILSIDKENIAFKDILTIDTSGGRGGKGGQGGSGGSGGFGGKGGERILGGDVVKRKAPGAKGPDGARGENGKFGINGGDGVKEVELRFK